MEQQKPSMRAAFSRAGTVLIPRLFAAVCIAAGLYASGGASSAEARPRHKATHHSHVVKKHAKKKSRKPRAPSTALVLKPAQFSDLPGWNEDNQAEAAIAFNRTCARIEAQDGDRSFGRGGFAGKFRDWQPACRAFDDIDQSSPAAVRSFFETMFRPWLATVGGRTSEGLFTGYYQATLHGSRVKTERYNVPLHLNPGGNTRYTRKQIMEGQWPHNKDSDVLVWVDDKVSAYFLHVQGSGQVLFEDGTSMYVKYDGDNHTKFRGVCLEFMRRGIMTRDTCSLTAIRNWIGSHSEEEGNAILESDPSYVFFRENPRGGSEGGEGVTLTPGRSLAIDYTKIPYGVPVYLDAEHPDQGAPRLRRLMMAQDTGGAIRGAIRGDFFWGAGPEAEALAGRMKSHGGYWLLLPRDLGKPAKKAEAAGAAPQAVPAAAATEAAAEEAPAPVARAQHHAPNGHSAAHGTRSTRYYGYHRHPQRHPHRHRRWH
jgi:membrane-bound lytic murein transglycosylase A